MAATVSVGDILAVLRLRDELSGTVQGIVRNASTELRRLGSEAQALGTSLTLGVTAPLVAAGTAGLKFGSEFETSMTKVVTIAGATSAQARTLRDEIMRLAPQTGQGPLALADAMIKIPLAALTAAQATDVLQVSAKASAIGMGSAKENALLLTAVLKAYGSENMTAAHAADIMLATIQEGNADIGELAGTMGRIVGISATVGVSFDQLGAFIATFTRLGVDASESVTALRGIMTTLLGPTKEAQDTLKSFGTSIEEVRQNVKEKGLTQAMMELMETLHGDANALDAVFGNVRALAGVMGVFTAQGKDVDQVLKNISSASGNVDRAFVELQKTTAFTWSVFKSQIEIAAIALGDRLAPTFKQVLESAKPVFNLVLDLIQWFGALPQPVQTTVIAVLGLAAALGPLLFVFGTLMTSVAAIGTLFGGLAPLMTALSWPIRILIAQISAFGLEVGVSTTAVYLWETALGKVSGAVSTVSTTAGAAVTRIGSMASVLGPLALVLISVGAGFLIAKNDMDNYMAGVEKHMAQMRESKDLNELWGKAMGTTGGAVMDLSRLTTEQKAILKQLADEADRNALSMGGLHIVLGDGKNKVNDHAAALSNHTRTAVDATVKQMPLNEQFAVQTVRLDQLYKLFPEYTRVVQLGLPPVKSLVDETTRFNQRGSETTQLLRLLSTTLRDTQAEFDQLGKDAAKAGFQTRSEMDEARRAAVNLFNEMAASGRYVPETLIAAWRNAYPEIAKHLDDVQAKHDRMVQTVAGWFSQLITGAVNGWGTFKQAAIGVGEDILKYFQDIFAKKMAAYIVDVVLGWAGVTQAANAAAGASAAASNVSVAAAGASSSAWMAAIAEAMVWYTLFDAFLTWLGDGPGTTPPPPPGGGGENPTGPGGDFGENLSFAQRLFDYANSTNLDSAWTAFQDYMKYHGDLWGHGNGFRTGTMGQYVDFGPGTLAVLHGKERITTEAEGRMEQMMRQTGGGGRTTVVMKIKQRELGRAIIGSSGSFVHSGI